MLAEEPRRTPDEVLRWGTMRYGPVERRESSLEGLGARRTSESGDGSGIEELLRRLLAAIGAGVRGASEAEIAAVERDLGVPLPADHRRFLLAAGGTSAAPAWRGLWRVDELVSLNANLPLFRWFGGLVGIGNEGFVVYALDYRRGPDPALVSVGLSSSDWTDVSPLAPTFAEWLEGTLPAP